MPATQPPQPPAKVGWRVIGLSPGSRPTVGGRFIDGQVVHFQLDTGTTSTVFLPDHQVTEQNVSEAIGAKARQLAGIARLSGQS